MGQRIVLSNWLKIRCRGAVESMLLLAVWLLILLVLGLKFAGDGVVSPGPLAGRLIHGEGQDDVLFGDNEASNGHDDGVKDDDDDRKLRDTCFTAGASLTPRRFSFLVPRTWGSWALACTGAATPAPLGQAEDVRELCRILLA
ncbi:hypothetical protein DFH06DRAFT_1337729 [Mycena polygramma]|nr:hypothetical protein DFH06DRAFT_1337729 [Mycena polygramma]